MPLSGSEEFIEQLLKQTFQSPNDNVQVMRGADVSGHSLLSDGFTKPILIPEKDGLRIRIPSQDFAPDDLLKYMDRNLTVDVIDVREQEEQQMLLGEFVEHFVAQRRSRLLNMLSLEFSQTSLTKLVEPPHVVSELSLITNCWTSAPDDEPDDVSDDEHGTASMPSVQKYCLLSMEGSYTDFHIDFGGSSVWYHVVWGEKVFYLIPPTSEHRNVYWKWTWNPDHRNIFLPDLLSTSDNDTAGRPVFELHVGPGQTILLPSGWIHAVYTPSDCLVFGGNFLNELHIPIQLSVYRMEQKSGTPQKFQFPNFEKIHWFAAERIAGRLTNALYDNREPVAYEIEAAHALVKVLSRWLEKRISLPADERNYYLPSRATMELSYSQLIDRLEELLSAFAPTHCKDRSKLDKRDRKVSKPAENSSRKAVCKNRYSFGSSPTPKRKAGGGLGWVPDRSTTAKVSSDRCATDQPITDDQDILEALPELNESRLVGDHYFLDLSDSDAEERVSLKQKRSNATRKALHRRKTRDPDPTWSGTSSSPRKSGIRSLKAELLAPRPSNTKLSKVCLTGGGLHPLLTEVPGPSSKFAKSSQSKAKGSSDPYSQNKLTRLTTSKTKSGNANLKTVRQRLAKRLGL